MAGPLTPFAGVVEVVTPTGFKLQGGGWVNYSRYDYKGPAGGQPAPSQGDTVSGTLKNDKFIVTLAIGGVLPQSPPMTIAQALSPATAKSNVITGVPTQHVEPQGRLSDLTGSLTPIQASLMEKTIEIRMKVLGVMAIAQPGMFVADQATDLTEMVRSLEQFVLEDLIAANTPEDDDDVDITADDVLDDEEI